MDENKDNIEEKENLDVETNDSRDEDQNIETEAKQQPDFKDKYQRLLAEFSNYQRQKEQELRSMATFGNSNLLLKIVDVLDDIEMGLMQENLSEETKSILTMVKEKVSHLLLLEGVKDIELKKGDEFDAMKCEAIQAVDAEESKNKIVQVVRKGYAIADRVLRTAKVIVGK